ncbi:MAG: hypothetical protein E7633_00595 [Ruminococcaceae bacterium]|nr:hypothetical protein [Oscillospiraceae bacterium]
MKKTIALLMSLITLFLPACVADNANNQTDEDEAKEKTYTLYCSSSDSNPIELFEDLNVKVSFESTPEWVGMGDTKDIEDSSISANFKYKFFEEEYDLELSYIKQDDKMKNSKLENFSQKSQYAVYKSTDGKAKFRFSTGSGELAVFSTIPVEVIENKLSDEKLKEIAEKTVSSVFDKNTLSDYVLWEILQGYDKCEKVVTYTRYIGKYRVNESISVWINGNGDVIAFNAVTKGDFDHLIDKVTEKDIESAVDTVKTILEGKNVTVEGRTLYVDSIGECYVSVIVTNLDIPEDTEDEQLAKDRINSYYVKVES